MTPDAAIAAAYHDRWDEAFAVMRAAADAGDDYARAQLDVLSGDLEALLQPPKMERVHETSSVFVCRGFAPPAICDWFVKRAEPRLKRALVHNALKGQFEEDSSRTNLTSVVEIDMINAVMQERAARLTRVPKVQHEPPTIISYEVGQKFDHHYDYINPEQPGAFSELLTKGQRTITIVTYLNTDFEGAWTDFPLLDIQFTGGKGDAILFSNVLANGSPDKNTLHAGLAPTAGRKWVLSQWIRNQPQPY